jgi:hypothetical protein
MGSAMDGEFLDQMSDYQLLKKDSDPWNYLSIYFGCTSPKTILCFGPQAALEYQLK